MTKGTPYFDMIEEYLENTLNPEDRYAFVEELTTNEILRNEVRKHQIAYAVIEMGIETSLRQKLEELGQKDQNEANEDFQYGYLIIITIIIAILLTVIFFMNQG